MTITEILDKYEISQSEFARLFGIPLRTVQHWAEGTRTPPDYLPALISETLLKREYDELIGSLDNLLLISALMRLSEEQFREVSDLVYRFDLENNFTIGMED